MDADDQPRDNGHPPRRPHGPEGEGDGPGGLGERGGRDPLGLGPGGRDPEHMGLGGPLPPPGAPPRPGESFQSMRDHDPEMYKLAKADMDLARHCMDLSDRYQHASAEEKAKLKTEIQETVGKNFEVRQKRRALELKRLEQELTRLRESIERREKDRQHLIDQRTSELTDGDPDKRF